MQVLGVELVTLVEEKGGSASVISDSCIKKGRVGNSCTCRGRGGGTSGEISEICGG